MAERYVIMWSAKGLERLLNIGDHERRYMISLLAEDGAFTGTGNPIREMIVTGVANRTPGLEIWQVESELSEDEIVHAFDLEHHLIKDEIRSVGSLIYQQY